MERALQHPHRPARYPFDGSSERMHEMIEDDMRLLEPSVLPWIPGHQP